MNIDGIIQSVTLFELLDAVDGFCRESILRDDDSECMDLIEKLKDTDNEYLTLLSSYLCACEDGDEVVEALYEFVSNCRGFAEADEEMTKQVTKEEFEAVLDECEDKCGLRSCIEENHILHLAEVSAVNAYSEFNLQIRNEYINLFLPRIDLNTDRKEYIAGELGIILYDVLKSKIPPETIKFEMNRYIPESRNTELSVKQLFKKYFYSVVLYQERKPGIYKNYDDHMMRVIVLEFFKRIIGLYLRE